MSAVLFAIFGFFDHSDSTLFPRGHKLEVRVGSDLLAR